MIPFNKPYLTGKELHFVAEAHSRGQLAGDGYFTKCCSKWLEQRTGCHKALLTHSCTAALEMASILANIKPGDEVIMPSYTFVSTANAFVLRGAVPVFVDIRADTLNIDENLIEAAITSKTKAIVPVHYAGVACEMDTIMEIASKYNLLVIEDAAQALGSSYKDRALGTIGHMGCFSFHETKNIISGEGGALLINSDVFAERAEIIREKGTNRSLFFRGQVDKYTWVDIGSSYLPGELIAAFLWAQMQHEGYITANRLALWGHYNHSFFQLETQGRLRRPMVPADCLHNAHMYYLLLQSLDDRMRFINAMKDEGISCVFHYVPLHTSPQGLISGRVSGKLSNTQELSDRIVRLPLWVNMGKEQEAVLSAALKYLQNSN